MFTSYMIQYMDKSVLGQAAIYDLITDLGLVGQQYSWCSSVSPPFFFSDFSIFPLTFAPDLSSTSATWSPSPWQPTASPICPPANSSPAPLSSGPSSSSAQPAAATSRAWPPPASS